MTRQEIQEEVKIIVNDIVADLGLDGRPIEDWSQVEIIEFRSRVVGQMMKLAEKYVCDGGTAAMHRVTATKNDDGTINVELELNDVQENG